MIIIAQLHQCAKTPVLIIRIKKKLYCFYLMCMSVLPACMYAPLLYNVL